MLGIVFEGYILKFDLTLDRIFPGMDGIGEINSGAKHLGDALERCGRAGKEHEHHRKHHQGHEDMENIVDERSHLRDIKRSADHLLTAKPDNREGRKVHDQHEQRHIQDDNIHCAQGCIGKAVIGGAELLLFKLLADKRFDHPDIGQVFLNAAVQAIYPLLHLVEERECSADNQPERD